MGQRGELFSTRVLLKNRTYFFNVKENRMGDLYLNIVESKNREDGAFDRQSVILFADDLQEFLKGFDDSLRILEKEIRERRRSARAARGPRDERDSRDVREPREGRDFRDAREERGGRPRAAHSSDAKIVFREGREERGRPRTGDRDSRGEGFGGRPRSDDRRPGQERPRRERPPRDSREGFSREGRPPREGRRIVVKKTD